MVLSILMLIDSLDDVLLVGWFGTEWSHVLGPELAEAVARTVPAVSWRFLDILVSSALAVLLLVSSVDLQRRRRTGVTLTRAWAISVIVWALVSTARSVWWLSKIVADYPVIDGWGFSASLGLGLGLGLLIAYPIFVLVWTDRPAVSNEWSRWA